MNISDDLQNQNSKVAYHQKLSNENFNIMIPLYC